MCFIYFKWHKGALLYEKDASLDVKVVKPHLFRDLHSFIWRFFTLFSGLYDEYQLYRGDKLASKAEVVSWLPIFSFMPFNGIHIGPCRTEEEERGKGYYPYLLSRIIESIPSKDFYMIIADNNLSSIRGVEKIGFKKYSKGRKTIMGRYVSSDF